MEQDKIPKYLQEVEEILREHYQGDELSEWLKMTEELIKFTREVEAPSGDAGQFVAQVLKLASKQQRPVVATYIGFRLGVAYERYQNEKSNSKL